MKTISRLIGLLAICITLNAQAQIINMNPDPSGKPWLSGDALSTPPEAWNDAVEFIPSVASLAAQLPSSVYNDQNIWFPYIFAQGGNASCVHVAELFYTFTYEMNRKLNVVPGDGITDLTNLYHPLYTYNFLNEGDSTTATYPKSGFNIIKENGCPPWDVYDDPVLYIPSKNYKYWMTGYSKYKQGVNNTISDIYRIDISIVSTGLDYLKHWIADHGNNESTGGLAIISINTAGWVPYSLIPSGSPHAGERYISSFGTIGSYNSWLQ